jgi:hypothetical protein
MNKQKFQFKERNNVGLTENIIVSYEWMQKWCNINRELFLINEPILSIRCVDVGFTCVDIVFYFLYAIDSKSPNGRGGHCYQRELCSHSSH